VTLTTRAYHSTTAPYTAIITTLYLAITTPLSLLEIVVGFEASFLEVEFQVLAPDSR
jgi:hypothetical protein